MGSYGDLELLPIVDEYVKKNAEYLNENKIDPFAYGARFEDPMVESYINCRESLVILKEGISDQHPDFDSKVETLDRQLLQHADFTDYGKPKIGRNDPCFCGSGKKYKRCCGRN